MEYKNQKDVDRLQEHIFMFVSPDLRLREFTLMGDCVVAVILRVPEKGNKRIIDDLISLGFRKKSRQMMKRSNYWSLSEPDRYEIVLEKEIGRKC